MNWQLGETVIVLDEDLEGEVIAFDAKSISIRCSDGFEYKYLPHQVYRKVSDQQSEFVSRSFELEVEKEVTKPLFPTIKLSNAIPEVDLHIDVLAPDQSFKSDHECLNYQLAAVREVISQAKRKRIRNIILVHGVGKGVLRTEIRQLLSDSYPEIEFLDANYQKYGAGATELIIRNFQEEM